MKQVFVAVGCLMALCGRAESQSYHVAKSFRLGGDGGWDLLTLDTARHRLFIAHQDRVLDLDTHRIYTVTADFGAPPAPTADHPHPRPPVIPGTLTLLVLEP